MLVSALIFMQSVFINPQSSRTTYIKNTFSLSYTINAGYQIQAELIHHVAWAIFKKRHSLTFSVHPPWQTSLKMFKTMQPMQTALPPISKGKESHFSAQYNSMCHHGSEIHQSNLPLDEDYWQLHFSCFGAITVGRPCWPLVDKLIGKSIK